ncbi:Phosphatidylinositol-4-phosphate 3-kinase [Aphelenchoides besseyi]|nr:Phosphatidylinositol-4-phosphate 3-kinase [Aphelenchoides besseyi]
MSSTHQPGERDLELELVLELSKQTFKEEEKRRQHTEFVGPNLIEIEDPRTLQRQATINQIKELCNFPPPVLNGQQSPWKFPVLPSISSTLHHSASFPASSTSLPSSSVQFVPQWNSVQTPINPRPNFSQSSKIPSVVRQTSVQMPTTKKAAERIPRRQSNCCAFPDLIDLSAGDSHKVDLVNDTKGIEEFDPLFTRSLHSVSDFRQSAFSTSLPRPQSVPVFQPVPEVEPVSSRKQILMVSEAASDYMAQTRLLSDYRREISEKLDDEKTVNFMAPVVDYMTTSAESIKIVVHEDQTWPQDRPEFPRKITFTCEINQTCGEILSKVLLDLLLPEELALNDGCIPLDAYALKTRGTDEFFDNSSIIGKHPAVGLAVATNKDVELECGKKTMSVMQSNVPFERQKSLRSSTIRRDNFQQYIDVVFDLLNEPKPEKEKIIKMLFLMRSSMNDVGSREFEDAIATLSTSVDEESTKRAIRFLTEAIIRQLHAFSRSTTVDFTIKSDLIVLPDQQTTTKELIEIDESDFVFCIEGLHNIPKHWSDHYSRYFVEVELMHGLNAFSLRKTSIHESEYKRVIFESWCSTGAKTRLLPRESFLSFVVYAERPPLSPPPDSRRELRPNNNYVRLASSVTPLFSHEGYLVQGSFMLGLTNVEKEKITPWGPRSLVHQPDDPILYVRFMEHDYRIKFPSSQYKVDYSFKKFKKMSASDQEYVQTLILQNHFRLLELDDDNKHFVWANRTYLSKIPEALPFVLLSAPSWDTLNLANIYPLIDNWVQLRPELAIELLFPWFPDSHLRSKAVDWLSQGSSAFLRNHVPELIEALRFELYENSALAKFLLCQCTKERTFAFDVYWQLNQKICEEKNPDYLLRCESLRDEVLKLDICGFRNEIAYQHKFMNEIHKIAISMMDRNEISLDAIVKNGLHSISNQMNISKLRVPLFPAFQCRGIKLQRCGYFNSFAKPIRVCFAGEKFPFSIIYKAMDDLRQDAVVMQLINLINDIWLREGHDMRLLTFRCLPTGQKRGIIEMVPNCQTFREIQTASGTTGVYQDDVLHKWLKANNPSELQYANAIENFRRSCAGWCVLSYLLGFCDRHNDNMLLCASGHMFHIDFGRYMGNKQMAGPINRDRAPFVLTPDMAYIINGSKDKTTEFQIFIDEMCIAFNLIRKHAAVVLNAIRFMSTAGIPAMDQEALNFVQNKLELDLTDTDMITYLTEQITISLGSWFTRANFLAHSLVQRGNFNEDFDHMPFNTSDDCTQEVDGRIEDVIVSKVHKSRLQGGVKVYMYECLVQRVGMAADPSIYRSFRDFEVLHLKLRCKFSNVAIPGLGRRRYISRTNIHEVAVQRQVELQCFLRNLFNLPDEISHCPLIYNFFHPIHADIEPPTVERPEARNLQTQRTWVKLDLTLDLNKWKLHIFVGHGQNVRTTSTEDPKTYVKFYLCLKDQLPPGLGKQKTPIVRSKNPTYNHKIVYELPSLFENGIFDSTLHVSIWQQTQIAEKFALCTTQIKLETMKQYKTAKDGVFKHEDWFQLEYE